MSNAKLTIKVGADVKGAAEQLKALGYNVENIQKKTEGVNIKAKAMDNVLNKSAGSMASLASGLGTSMMGAAAAIALATKGVKAIVEEGLKVNENARNQVDKINGVWTEIKADLGSALLDTISPALETLYDALVAIERKVMQMTSGTALNNALNTANRKSDFDFKSYSDYEIINAYLARQKDTNNSWRTSYQWGLSQLKSEIDSRNIGGYLTGDGLEILRQRSKITSSSTSPTATSTTTVQDPYEALLSSRGKNSITYQKNQLEEEMKQINALLANPLYADDQNKYEILVEMLRSCQEEYQNLGAVSETVTKSLTDDIDAVLSQVSTLFGSLNAFSNQFYETEIARVEKSTESEEEKAKKIDGLKRKQFAADKANSIAALTISTAQGIMNATATYAGNIPMMSTMIGLISATSAVQLASILSQEYTGLASGGIVSQPTKALIGEGGEKEAVMPLSKLDEFVNREERGTITIVVNINGKGDTAEDVYYAIERAQRTGLLPKWRYA